MSRQTGRYADAMRTTIDKAGRVVIPAAGRQHAGLIPGGVLEIVETDLGVRLDRVAAGPKLVKIGWRLVARPAASPEKHGTSSTRVSMRIAMPCPRA